MHSSFHANLVSLRRYVTVGFSFLYPAVAYREREQKDPDSFLSFYPDLFFIFSKKRNLHQRALLDEAFFLRPSAFLFCINNLRDTLDQSGISDGSLHPRHYKIR